MANKRITELTDIGTPDPLDVLEIVDTSDTTDSPEGTSKKVKVSELGSGGTFDLSVNEIGSTPISSVNQIEFDGATVTDEGGGKVKVTITGGGTTPSLFDVLSVGDRDVQTALDGDTLIDLESHRYLVTCDGLSGNTTFIVPTFADFISAFPLYQGSYPDFKILNNSAFTITLEGDTDVTLLGSVLDIPINAIACIKRITDSDTYSVTYQTNTVGGGAVDWGGITGTLSDQTDLQTALDLKSDKVSWMVLPSDYTFPIISTTVQKIFNVGSSGNGSIPVTSEKRYRYKMRFIIENPNNTTMTFVYDVLGTATYSQFFYMATTSRNNSLTIGANAVMFSGNATPNAISINSNTRYGQVIIDGEFSVSGTGTFIPAMRTTVADTINILAGADIYIEEVGLTSDNSSSDII